LALAEAATSAALTPSSREKNTGKGVPDETPRWSATRRHSPGTDGAPAGHVPVSIWIDGVAIGWPQIWCSWRIACAAARAASVSVGLT
jgi:hypothetical protein